MCGSTPGCRSKRSKKAVILWSLTVAAAVAAGIALYVSGHASSLQAYLMKGPLGRNGMLAAFCLIFLSELGDKTFFIAALLAMKLGKLVSFVGEETVVSLRLHIDCMSNQKRFLALSVFAAAEKVRRTRELRHLESAVRQHAAVTCGPAWALGRVTACHAH